MVADAGGGSGGRSRAPYQGGADPVTRPLAPTAPLRTLPPPMPRGEPSRSVKRAPTKIEKPRLSLRFFTACKRSIFFFGRCAAVGLPLLAVVFGLLYVKLLNGPLSVRFLVAPIETALNAELQGLTTEIDDAVLKLSERGGLEFRLTHLRIRDSNNELVAGAKLAAIEISAQGLRNAQLLPSRIDLIEPEILVARTADGRLVVSVNDRSDGALAAGSKPREVVSPPNADGGASRLGAVPMAGTFAGIAAEITRVVGRMRRNETTSHLNSIGFRDATLTVESNGRRDSWKLPTVDVALLHFQKRSSLSIDARIVSGNVPWTFSANVEEGDKSQTIKISSKFAGLVPKHVLPLLSGILPIEGVDLPVDGNAAVELSTDGDIKSLTMEMLANPGNVHLAWLDGAPLPIERGQFLVSYDGYSRQAVLAPSVIETGSGRIVIEGVMSPDDGAGKASPGWQFDLKSREGHIESVDKGAPVLTIDKLNLVGRIMPGIGEIHLQSLGMKAGAAEIQMTGLIGRQAMLEGRIGAMSIADLKSLWPASIAPRARAFVHQSLTKGTLNGGSFRIETLGDQDPVTLRAGNRRMSLTLEASDLRVGLRNELPPIEIPRALLRLEGNALELSVPDALVTASHGRRISFKGTRATVVEINSAKPVAEIVVKATGPLAAVVDLLERDEASPIKGHGVALAHIEGKTEANLKLTVPLGEKFVASDIRVEGRARVLDGRVKDIIGTHDISGASLTLDFVEKGIDIKGDALLAGVNTKLFGHLPAVQPEVWTSPVTITARLDNADRQLLGIELDSMLQGEIPVQITLQKGVGDEIKPHVIVDLTAAELMLEELAWRKPMGRPGKLEFDIGKKKQTKTLELQNFKLIGETIAVDGWVELGPDMKAREYYFPGFSLNVVTNLAVQGTLRPDRIWEIKAQGKTVDGTEMFRALFAFGNESQKVKRKIKPGLDLSADIENVIGANDTALRQVKIKISKRLEQIIGIDVRGNLDGGAPLQATMLPEPNRPRTLVIRTQNGGQALKMIGFYPNMLGGRAELEVNLDGRGAVEKTGKIHIENFSILGDAVLAEVFQGTDDSRPVIANSAMPKRRMVREQFDFESLEAAFDVGNAQVVIERAVALGPLIGASLAGKFDFKAQRLRVDGTYVPLSGLSRAIGQIPLLGQILTGTRGEGLLGINYVIEGGMANPQVTVNPLSIVAPGILREMFQLAPQNFKITPRLEGATRGGVEAVPQVRASPPLDGPVEGRKSRNKAPPKAQNGEIIDGWSTTESKAEKKK